MSLKTRLRHCLKGCYFYISDVTEKFCRIRCVHGAAEETLQKQGESGHDEGSLEEMEGPVEKTKGEKKWGVSSLYQPLVLIYLPSCYMEIYRYLTLGVCISSGTWHQHMVQVSSFEGCVQPKRWPIQPRKIFLCLAG